MDFDRNGCKCRGCGMPWYKQSGAFSVGLPSTTSFDGPLPGDGDLPLPKSVRGAILASERPGIW